MEKHKFFFGGLFALKHGEVLTEIIALNEGMCHFNAFGFHGMLFTEVIVGDGVVIEVAYLSHFEPL
jgi:hypothetical protein